MPIRLKKNKTLYAQIFGKEIRKQRKQLGWTQEKLAQEAHTCTRNISRIENGERYPTTLTLYLLRKALKMEQDPLIEGVMEKAERVTSSS